MTVAVAVAGPGWGVLAADSRGEMQGRALQVQKIQALGPTALGAWAGTYQRWPATDQLPRGLDGAEAAYRWLRSHPQEHDPIMLLLTRDPEPHVYRATQEGITVAKTGDLLDTTGTLESLPIAQYTEADGRRLALYWLAQLISVPRLRSAFPLHVVSVGPDGVVGELVMSESDLKHMEET